MHYHAARFTQGEAPHPLGKPHGFSTEVAAAIMAAGDQHDYRLDTLPADRHGVTWKVWPCECETGRKGQALIGSVA